MSTTRRWMVALGVTTALLGAGAGTALADTGAPPSGTAQPGPITLTPEESAFVCDTRIPNALKRIEKLTSTAGASATTRGSTAWLQAKEDTAKTAGRTDLAAAVQKRIDARPAKLAKLADAQKRLEAFQSEHCS
jgi:hypothetical protein